VSLSKTLYLPPSAKKRYLKQQTKVRSTTLLGARRIMKRAFILTAIAMLAVHAYAMEIILPRDVLQHFLIACPEQEFKQRADATKILKHNKQHTEQYVILLLKSLQGDTLRLKNEPEDASLIVTVIAPMRVDFVFEKRMSKWVDGADYDYYTLIGINEETPNIRVDHIPKVQ
jgi:hypothetical protein